jgi:hypothetical protein
MRSIQAANIHPQQAFSQSSLFFLDKNGPLEAVNKGQHMVQIIAEACGDVTARPEGAC